MTTEAGPGAKGGAPPIRLHHNAFVAKDHVLTRCLDEGAGREEAEFTVDPSGAARLGGDHTSNDTYR